MVSVLMGNQRPVDFSNSKAQPLLNLAERDACIKEQGCFAVAYAVAVSAAPRCNDPNVQLEGRAVILP